MRNFGAIALAAIGLGGLLLFGRKAGAASGEPFRLRWLTAARRYSGMMEEGGNNRGHQIDIWNTSNKSPLGSSYCANFLAAMAREVGGFPGWLSLSSTAKVWMSDAQRAKQWISKAEAIANPSLVEIGYFAVWDRTQPDNPDETSWMGHIGLVGTPIKNGSWLGTEANTGVGNGVLPDVPRNLTDPKLLGFGKV